MATRLYANENFPRQVVEALRARGLDVLTSAEAGKAGRAVPDDEVLRHASAEDRAVVTFKRRHFVRLHIDRCSDQPQEFAAMHIRCPRPRCALPASATPSAPARQASHRHRRASGMVTLVCHSPILGRIRARTGALAR